MPDLLTGIALQRAIAERKGWKNLRTDGEVWGLLHGDDPEIPGRRVPPYMPEDDNLHQFHALLAELVGAKDASKRWRLEILIDGKGVSMTATRAVPGKDDIEWREVDADCDNAFCVAAGNLWLRCGE